MKFYFTRYNTVVLGQTIAVEADNAAQAEELAKMGEYDEVGDEFTQNVIGDPEYCIDDQPKN